MRNHHCDPSRAETSGRRSSIAHSFDSGHNSLNFIRLVLASAVIFTHASQLSRNLSENLWGLNKTTIGTMAVYGFFGISGFLVAKSVTNNGVGRYLWKRCLRVLPAFWVCLLIVAFGYGLIGWYVSHPPSHCDSMCYLREANGPFGYVYHNLLLYIWQPGISHTLSSSSLPNLWNGSLWTLAWEFLCYLLLAAAAIVGLIARRWTIVVLTTCFCVANLLVVAIPELNSQVNAFHHPAIRSILALVPVFLVGTCIYLYRERIPDSRLLAIMCTALFIASFVVPIGNRVPAYTLTSVDGAAIFLAYPLIWLGMHLPFQRIGSKNDYSYGMYIYGFPTQQLLVILGATSLGYMSFAILGLLATIPLAVGSWWLVERPALSFRALRWGDRRESQLRLEVEPGATPSTDVPDEARVSQISLDRPVR